MANNPSPSKTLILNGSSYLNKTEYEAVIKEACAFIQKWLAQQKLNPRLRSSLHTGIQRFMGDTLSLTEAVPEKNSAKITTHLPFAYDYEDFKGEQDFRNFFLTKTLATGTGQCNSLPAVYLILAEALGAPAYLSFAPHHALVKYRGDNGILHNYEATSNWNITDEWYMDNLSISPEAVQSGIYLDTLNKKQVVANCLVDLAHGYMKKFGLADGTFIADCLQEAEKYFPKRNNITAYFILSCCLARKLDRVLRSHHITDLKNLPKIPEAQDLYDALMQNEAYIRQLGYQEQPKELYDQLMTQQEFKGKRQESSGVNAKQKRSLFIHQ